MHVGRPKLYDSSFHFKKGMGSTWCLAAARSSNPARAAFELLSSCRPSRGDQARTQARLPWTTTHGPVHGPLADLWPGRTSSASCGPAVGTRTCGPAAAQSASSAVVGIARPQVRGEHFACHACLCAAGAWSTGRTSASSRPPGPPSTAFPVHPVLLRHPSRAQHAPAANTDSDWCGSSLERLDAMQGSRMRWGIRCLHQASRIPCRISSPAPRNPSGAGFRVPSSWVDVDS
jgi:hypothetical protein